MPSSNRKFGNTGEETAAKFLLNKGFRIISMNYSKPWGEIDIVAEKDNIIRFVEVKTSRFYPSSGFTPEDRINKDKITSLRRVCETYVSENKLPPNKEWQIDVISVILNVDNTVYEIRHTENAVFERRY